jgi:hypothetical protein
MTTLDYVAFDLHEECPEFFNQSTEIEGILPTGG